MLFGKCEIRRSVLVLLAGMCLAAGNAGGSAAEFSAQNRDDAPFGLKWALSADETRKLGVTLDGEKRSLFGQQFAASNLPRVLTDAESVQLFYGFDDRLWRVVAVSKAFGNDPYGNQVIARYNELAKVLSEKYGKGSLTHTNGGHFYQKPENFVYGVSNGNIYHYTDFNTPILSIQLAIRAFSMDSAVYVIIFENKALKQEFEKSKVAEEKKAL